VRSESAKGSASPASAAGSSKTQTKPLLQALASPSFYKFLALPEVLQVGKLVPIAEEEDADDDEEEEHAHADVAFGQEKHALADAALVDGAVPKFCNLTLRNSLPLRSILFKNLDMIPHDK
jgi:hypothetical protein